MTDTITRTDTGTAPRGAAPEQGDEGELAYVDYYAVDSLLTDEERAVRDKVRRFCDQEVIPVMQGYWERAEFPFEMIPKIAALGIAGGSIPTEYGCPGLSAVATGQIAIELARGDGSVNTFYGVHSGLAMGSIYMLGSEEQRHRWLPAMARMEKIGAFGLTEPTHGSDSVALETSARLDGDEYVLDGAKKWIGNASFADLVIIWARNGESGQVNGFVVEKGTPGFTARVITGKVSKRAVWQAEITLDNVRVPKENRLENCHSFKDLNRVLTATRYGVAIEAIGHAIAAYECAVAYVKERVQFGRPLANAQLIQFKLAGMLADITSMQVSGHRLSQLLDEGTMTAGQASLAKMNNCRLARKTVAEARDLLGGNGILLEYIVARHFADMEAVYTYEGSDSVQALIVGRTITGVQAFV